MVDGPLIGDTKPSGTPIVQTASVIVGANSTTTIGSKAIGVKDRLKPIVVNYYNNTLTTDYLIEATVWLINGAQITSCLIEVTADAASILRSVVMAISAPFAVAPLSVTYLVRLTVSLLLLTERHYMASPSQLARAIIRLLTAHHCESIET